MSKILYRAEYSEHRIGLQDSEVYFREFCVTRETARGVWVEEQWAGSLMSTKAHFILNASRKRLAYPTKAEAVEYMRHRKRKYIKILQSNLRQAHAALSAAEAWDEKPMLLLEAALEAFNG